MRHLTVLSLLIMLCFVDAARGEEEWQRRLPPEWLGVIVVNDLSEFDRQSARIAEMFGMEAPGLVRLIDAAGLTDITNAKGSWLAGLARGPMGAEEPYPFAMIPVKDFAALVAALDGDMRRNTAIVTIAQQDLLAGNCGPWTLLMNFDQQEIFDSVMARDANEDPDGTKLNKSDGLAAAHLSQLGLNWLAAYPPLRGESVRERAIARRKRGLAMLSVEGVRESLALDRPLWEWVAKTFSEASVALKFDEEDTAIVRVMAAKSQVADGAERSEELKWGDHFVEGPWISVGYVLTSDGLIRLATGWQIAQLKSAPEELGIKAFAPAETSELESSLEKLLEHVSVAQFAVLADDELPIYGNRAALLRVADGKNFIAACDDFMERWNALIAASQAEVKLTFSAESVEIGGRSGRRYFVDMVEAVDVPRSREVAKVMSEMFGAEGILNWYALPLTDNRVFVANLPRERVAELLSNLQDGSSKPKVSRGMGAFQFDASAYVDWGKRRDLAMMGEVIGGPKFVPLPNSEPLDAALTVRDRAAQLEVVLPQSLLETLGKHAQEMREP